MIKYLRDRRIRVVRSTAGVDEAKGQLAVLAALQPEVEALTISMRERRHANHFRRDIARRFQGA